MSALTDTELVRKIADGLIGEINSPGKPPETDEMQIFYDVYCLDMEIGSAASFEQYFRWSGKEQVDEILNQLREVGLQEIIVSVKKAIDIAFPNGVPEDRDTYQECTDWTEE